MALFHLIPEMVRDGARAHIVVGETRTEVLALTREAIGFQIEGLRDEGIEIPDAHVSSEFVDVQAA
jgi:predicted RNase H-like HicB family nuclease